MCKTPRNKLSKKCAGHMIQTTKHYWKSLGIDREVYHVHGLEDCTFWRYVGKYCMKIKRKSAIVKWPDSRVPAVLFTECVILVKLLNISEPQFSHL